MNAVLLNEYFEHPPLKGFYLLEFQNEFTGSCRWRVGEVVDETRTIVRYSKYGRILRFLGPLVHSIDSDFRGDNIDSENSTCESAAGLIGCGVD